MKKFVLPGTILGGILIAMLQVGAAQAQATRTWVSGVGDDANPCSRTAPCKTFAGAISKTAAGGEINCIDPGGFGAVTITKSMTIDCVNTEAGVLTGGTNGVIVNAGVNDIVVLRGLDIFGTISQPSLNGVRFLAGAALFVEKCTIREYQTAAPNGNGISFEPSGASKLFVSDTVLTSNGTGGTGGGISIKPTGTGAARANIVGSRLNNNINGINADGSATTGTSVIYVSDTVVAGSVGSALFVFTPGSGGGSTAVMLDRSSMVNSTNGVNVSGPKSAAFLAATTVFGNSNGLVSTGGTIVSYKNNNINGGNSPTDGAPTSSVLQN
jgi:hypothetical protein